MIVPTIAQTPLVGYRLIVVALIATGFFSFGLWVHHMFTTGMPAHVARLLLGREHGGRDPDRHPGLRLDRDDRRRRAIDQTRDAVAVRPRLSLHLHARRADRRDGGDGARSTGRRTTPISSSRISITC